MKELCVVWKFQRAGGCCEPVPKNELQSHSRAELSKVERK